MNFFGCCFLKTMKKSLSWNWNEFFLRICRLTSICLLWTPVLFHHVFFNLSWTYLICVSLWVSIFFLTIRTVLKRYEVSFEKSHALSYQCFEILTLPKFYVVNSLLVVYSFTHYSKPQYCSCDSPFSNHQNYDDSLKISHWFFQVSFENGSCNDNPADESVFIGWELQ